MLPWAVRGANCEETVTDKIFIEGLRARGRHGNNPLERDEPQEFLIDVECGFDAAKAAASDDLDDAVDYDELIPGIKEVVATRSFRLLEALGETIAAHILVNATIQTVRVRIVKSILSGDDLGAVGVVIERSRNQAGEGQGL